MSNSYNVNHTPDTPTDILIVILNETAFGGAPSMVVANQQKNTYHGMYETKTISLPYENAGNFYFDHETVDLNEELIKTATEVYTHLSENQEALGPEFEQVLNDNLWDLYAR